MPFVEDVLTAFRYDPRRGATMPLRRQPVAVAAAAIAEAAAERLRGRHPGRPLELDVEPGLSTVEVDPVLFRRVIDNLLENAHEYTPDGAASTGLHVRRPGDEVELVVVDRGIGIDAADLPKVYDAFFRAERRRARESGGGGLGLTLARRIVEGHGGTIELTRRADERGRQRDGGAGRRAGARDGRGRRGPGRHGGDGHGTCAGQAAVRYTG